MKSLKLGNSWIFVIFEANLRHFHLEKSIKHFGKRLLDIQLFLVGPLKHSKPRSLSTLQQKCIKKYKNFGFLGSRKKFRLLMQSCCFFCFFFSLPFHENFKFLKNCPYDTNEILYSYSTRY